MRYMIMIRASKDTQAGIMRSDDTLIAKMANYHKELQKAGVLLDGNGRPIVTWRL